MLELQGILLGIATNTLLILSAFLILFILLKKRKLIIATSIMLFISTLPITYRYPLYLLEKNYLLNDTNDTSVKAIVVLGGGTHNRSHLRETDVSRSTLERVRFAAFLQKKLSLPILASGVEADTMKRVIEEDFNGKVEFVENQSRTTTQNAQFSYTILKEHQIKKIYLVTTSWHLQRSEYLFHKHAKGIEVIPISGLYYSNKIFKIRPSNFLPNMHTHYFQNIILREAIALFWYKYVNN